MSALPPPHLLHSANQSQHRELESSSEELPGEQPAQLNSAQLAAQEECQPFSAGEGWRQEPGAEQLFPFKFTP